MTDQLTDAFQKQSLWIRRDLGNWSWGPGEYVGLVKESIHFPEKSLAAHKEKEKNSS
jgi:hypothetical protein